MLTSLLPGLRQLRTPIASGAVIALTIVLAVGVGRLDGTTATGLVRDMAALVNALGRPVALAGLGFAVYLLGVLWQSTLYFAFRAICKRVSSKPVREVYRATSHAVLAGVSKRVLNEITDVTTTRLRKALSSGTSSVADEFKNARLRYTDGSEAAGNDLIRLGARKLVPEATRELLELVPTRLIAAEKELWASWDQARAEGEFRAALAVPLAALTATLALVYHPLWWFGVLIAPLLLRIGLESGRRATEVLLEAIRVGKAVLFDDNAVPDIPWNTVVSDNVTSNGVVAAAN